MPLPFVVGTDIIQLTRPTYQNLARLQRLARRILHPVELESLRQTRPRIYEELELIGSRPTHAQVPRSDAALLNNFRAETYGTAEPVTLVIEPAVQCSSADTELRHQSYRLKDSKRDPDPSPSTELRTFIAGRWAAKEAARKAWGAHSVSFKDVRVEKIQSDWQPPGALHVICQPDGVTANDPRSSILQQEGALSISHDGDYVVATVVAEPLKLELREAFTLSTDKSTPLQRD